MRLSADRKSVTAYNLFFRLVYTISFLFIAYQVIANFSFYSTPYEQRPRHQDYRELRPAGRAGHALGVVGSGMMLFMLLYSLRKRTKVFGKAGQLRKWLDVHIYFGIIGPLLVVLHTSFKVQGLVAVSFWSMVAVALSGVFGRYLYLQIPRDVGGVELGRDDLDKLRMKLGERLEHGIEIEDDQVERIRSRLASKVTEDSGYLRSLLILFLEDIARPFKIRKLRKELSKDLNLSHEAAREIVSLFLEQALLKRRVMLLNQVQTLFHYWHVFHKPFAIIMYLIMIVHVVVAVWLGYVWIF
jgi:hypothetical protein